MRKIYSFLALFIFISALQAQDYRFGKVSSDELLEKAHPVEKDANAAVLYRSVSTYYEFNQTTGFTLITDVHERIKIYNKDGFNWANQEVISFKNASTREKVAGLKASTYNINNGKIKEEKLKKNGIFEEETSKYQSRTKFAMPAVTEGSVVEFQYSLRSPFVTAIDDIPLQYTIPINRLEVSVKIPEFLGYKKHLNLKSPLDFPMQESKRKFSYNTSEVVKDIFMGQVSSTIERGKIEYLENITTLKKDMIPGLKEETHIDFLSNYAAMLSWELQYTKFPNSIPESFSTTWEAVAKSIYKDGGYDKELSRSNYFAKDIDKLLAGETNPVIKAQKIYYFLKAKVKWNSYLGFEAENGSAKAYKDGVGNVGDINLMLTAMLKYANLDASPVLVSTQNNGIPIFPTRKGFNYVISALELPTGFYLLDATDENAAFGELPVRARNWNGRIIRNVESSDWVTLMPREQSKMNTILNIEIEEKALKGKFMNSISGLYAKTYRDNFKNANSDSYIQYLERNKGDIAISDLLIENQTILGEDIKETYAFELNNGVEVINEKLYLKPMLFIAELENPFKANDRQYPIFFDYPSIQSSTINIMVPEGYEVESLPESSIMELKSTAGSFKFVVLDNGKFVRIRSILDFKEIVYSPEDYQILNEFYSNIIEKHSEAIVLRKI